MTERYSASGRQRRCSNGGTEIMALSGSMFHRERGDETNLPITKPFSAFRADVRKQPLVIKLPNQTAATSDPETYECGP
jgi:hypothetical protein